MAPGLVSQVPGNIFSQNERMTASRQVSSFSNFSANFDSDSISQNGLFSRRESNMHRGRFNGLGSTSELQGNVNGLIQRSSQELGENLASKVSGASYEIVKEWIRIQRMSHLPAEGSHYDKVLTWAKLFIDRLCLFDDEVGKFSDHSYAATQRSYGYCLILLELGKKHASALMTCFGFFYSISATLVNLLERTELFAVSQDTREQLELALSDLVFLIHDVATFSHNVISDPDSPTITVNMYEKFHDPIFKFKGRCVRITEAMWRHQISQAGRESKLVDTVEEIRVWLAPEDRVLTHLAENTSHLAHEREEMTCLWVARPLTDFLKSKFRTLAITGKPGSGKTVAGSVIHDRLQDPVGGVQYKTLYIPINGRVPAETTPIAIVKTILSQLFEKRIGNVALLNILIEAYEKSKVTTGEAEYQGILWKAVEDGLAAALQKAKQLVIIVDGLDEAKDGEASLLQNLITSTASGSNVRLITLGAEKPKKSDTVFHFPIHEHHISDDISTVVRASMEGHKIFKSLPEMDQEIIVDAISGASNGSFLWAKLAAKRVRHETTAEALSKAADQVATSKASINDLVLHAIQSPDITDEVRQVLLWLATSERPFSTKEISTLATIDVTKQTITDRGFKLRETMGPVNNLVFIQDGQVGLRHGLIRSALQEIHSQGKLVPTIKDRHADFVTRLFIYIKSVLPEQTEPSLHPLEHSYTSLQLKKNPLLDFAVRYWPRHFTQTTTYTTGGDVPTAKEFSKIFPANISLLLFQNTLWRTVITPTLVFYQNTVTNICRTILTTKNLVTLQSLISLAHVYRDIDLILDSIPLFYEVTILSRDLLGFKHVLTMTLSSTFIELTSQYTTTSRTDIMIKREQILILAIECYKSHYTETSKEVLSTLDLLVEHYRKTGEEKNVQVTIEWITRINKSYQGEEDKQDVSFRIGYHQEEEHQDDGIWWTMDAQYDESAEDEFDYEALIKEAESYRSEGKIAEAERIYVEIWQRTNKQCRIQSTAFWEEIKLKSVVAYSKFLQQTKRETEASSILSSVWEEHRHTSLALSEKSTEHFKEIATMMTAVGLSSAALSIFKQVSNYYQSTNQTSRVEEMQKRISSTHEKVVKSASSHHSSFSETTLEEIVEESFTSGNITENSFAATVTLVDQFYSEHRWKDTTRVLKKVLKGLWPTLFAPTIQDVVVPSENTDQAIKYAERLAECYHYRRRFVREENIRVRVYRAVRASRPVEDGVRVRVTQDLILFFGRSSQPDKVITTQQEKLDDYTKHYKPDHPAVVDLLWKLAELTRPRPIFVDYYQRIIQALNKQSQTCKPEALKPLDIVANELWTQSRYSDAVSWFTLLFNTFRNNPKQPFFEKPDYVHETFVRYMHCLRAVRTEYKYIYTITRDYREKVKEVFTATASITIQATLTYAKVCQESKNNEKETIELYEELRKYGPNEIFDLKEIEAILDGIYEEQTAAALSNSQQLSKEQVSTAHKRLTKRIKTIRDSRGWAHSESLSQLKEFVSFESKYGSRESVVQELRKSTMEILHKESSSTQLVTAAAVIASSYIATNQVHKAVELSKDLYRQVVMKDTSVKAEYDLTSKSRQSLAFLAQLEHSSHKQNTSVTDILAQLTTEYVYFEEFRSYTASKTASFHTVTLSASRLYWFLKESQESQRQEAAARILDEFVAYFLATEGKRTQLTNAAQVKTFLTKILEHFYSHKSTNFLRSVGILSNENVMKLLEAKKYDEAESLARAGYRYITTQDAFGSNSDIVKFVFTLGITITGRTVTPMPEASVLKKLQQPAAEILNDALKAIRRLKINLSQMSLNYLNILISLLGEKQDYKTLVWLLSSLWASRTQQVTWPAHVTLGLARRYILARYLDKDHKAVRLAEDLVYNCRRVNGAGHSSTLEMSTLLTQLYTGIAEQYQAKPNGQSLAKKYYKKSANLHENLLRIFVDPEYAEFEGGLDQSFSMDGSALDFNVEETPNGSGISEADHVRHHLHLLKLSVQRLGGYPKDSEEYERLNQDLVTRFGDEIKGVEGIEKWNLKGFGSGKASGKEDTLIVETIPWELELSQPVSLVEEEL